MSINIPELAGNLVTAARNIIPAMIPGAAPFIAAGSAILDAMNNVRADLTEPVENFDETLDELHDRVNAKWDAVAARLRG